MDRILEPEILDSLSPDDPSARRSRRDLRIINRMLGSERWLRHVLRCHLAPGERVIELGSGTGEMGMALAKAGLAVDGLDLCPRPADWPRQADWHRADIRGFARYAEYSAVIANLTLHHLTAGELAALGRHLEGARLIVASEPARRRLSQSMFAAIGPLLGASSVTLHDARVSIAAGFLQEELPRALGLMADRWTWKCWVSRLGAYRMVALRR
jgi:2-polyprenyl-3-methyl-5-hydroxy-6-metoxy-1,4-benzoquinol methylase